MLIAQDFNCARKFLQWEFPTSTVVLLGKFFFQDNKIVPLPCPPIPATTPQQMTTLHGASRQTNKVTDRQTHRGRQTDRQRQTDKY